MAVYAKHPAHLHPNMLHNPNPLPKNHKTLIKSCPKATFSIQKVDYRQQLKSTHKNSLTLPAVLATAISRNT